MSPPIDQHRICVPRDHYIALYRIAMSAVAAVDCPDLTDGVARVMIAELRLHPSDVRRGCLREIVDYARRRIERSLS